MMTRKTHRFLLLLLFVTLVAGCAEGLFWKSGYLSPWARQQWSEDEMIAATLFARRAEIQEKVDAAVKAGTTAQEEVAGYLSEIITNDPVLLMRIEAVKSLGRLPAESAINALQVAANDREKEVRMAATRALELIGGEQAGDQLSRLARNDEDIDVRIAATAALGSFDSPLVRQTLSGAIQDPDPAIQLRAAESLASITGEDFGNDIKAWQAWLQDTPATEPERQPQKTVERDTGDPLSAFR